ncbi:Uncharacterized protein BM_BM8486 [Brugia malayi]|uniref:Uncharacterized protein n=1 Tax=Brugia malayi TaxID=6279 RepID=A0A4E9F1G0_BRUMA|nr:Uncharacterized protein BM_BM8486 [Brugia malayi]VIO89714.1 Uncharacterized protein BM_BM8486 [Brugia malayi]
MHYWHFSNDQLQYFHIFQNVLPLYSLILVSLLQFSNSAM